MPEIGEDDMSIWPTTHQEQLTVRAQINQNGSGVFTLHRFKPDGTTEPIGTRIEPAGAVAAGHAVFRISAAELAALNWANQSLQLRIVAGTPAGTNMSAFLRVEQPSGPLTPEDSQGDELDMQENGLELDPVLAHNVPGLWSFRVRFL